MNTLRVGLECVLIAVVMWSALFVIGWPLWRVVAGHAPALSTSTGAPLTGLALTQILGWYWAHLAPLDVFAYVVLGIGAAVSLVVAVREMRWRELTRTRLWRPLALLGASGAVVSGLFVWNHQPVFRIGWLSTGVMYVAPDLPQYAAWSDHLRTSTIQEAGSLLGTDVGSLVASTTAGAFVTLASAAAWSFSETWLATLPLALVCLALVATGARDLVGNVTGQPGVVASIGGVAAVAASFVAYSAAVYPLSQLLGMVAAVALAAILVRVGDGDSGVVSAALQGAVPMAVLIMSYPHMAVLVPPILIVVALAGCWRPEWRTRCVFLAKVVLGIAIACVVVLPERVVHAIDYVVFIGESTSAGFSLPMLSPVALLGVQGEFSANTASSTLDFLLQAIAFVVLAVLALVVVDHRDRHRSSVAAILVGAVLASYGAIFALRPDSYSAWKWAAFLVPLFVVGVVCSAIFVTRQPRGRRTRPSLAVLLALLLVLVTSQAVAAHSATDVFEPTVAFPGAKAREWLVVDDAIRSLGTGRAWRGVEDVTNDVIDPWGYFWAYYFVPAPIVRRGGYLPVAGVPRDGWILEGTATPEEHPPGTEIRVVNERFRLVRERDDRVAPGTLWRVGLCAGLYEFDGRHWVALERTPTTGGHELDLVANEQPVGTRTTLVQRLRATGLVVTDSLQLEFLAGGRARLVVTSALRGGDVRVSKPFAFPRDTPVHVSTVFDPRTSEVSARVDGVEVLDTTMEFVRPFGVPTLVGIGQLGPQRLRDFPGSIKAQQVEPERCTAAVAAGSVE